MARNPTEPLNPAGRAPQPDNVPLLQVAKQLVPPPKNKPPKFRKAFDKPAPGMAFRKS